MAGAYPIAEGELEINADPSEAWRNVQAFLRRVDQRLHASEDEAERSGRRAGRRYGDGLNEGLRGASGSSDITDLILGPRGGGAGEGEGGGGGGGFVESLISSLTGGFRRILDEIRDLITNIEEALSNLGGGGGGGGFLQDLRDGLNDLITQVRNGLISVIHYLRGTWTRLMGVLGGPALSGLWTRFLGWIRLVWSRFSAWASSSFSALWTRIRSFGTSMQMAARVLWARFTTWAIASFRTLSALASAFWVRMRAMMSYHWTTFSVIGRWLWGQFSRWASGAFTRIRGWASRLWSGMSSRGRSMWTRFASWARSAATSVGGWFSSLFTTISGWVTSLGSHLSSTMSGLSGAAGAVGPLLQVAFYTALVPLVLGLGGALANLLPLLLLLPAALGTLVSILAPAIVGFKGLGEAIGAGLSGDVEKLNEALKKLTPNARSFVKEFIKLGPALKEIKRQTQDALFKPLLGSVAPLAKTLLPALATGMAKAAGALGRLLAGFAKMLGTPEVISAINALFATTERILDRLGPPLANLFGALFGTVEGGLPWIERLVDILANGIDKFANWLREIKGNGEMQSWLETAWDAANKFWNLLVAVGDLIGALFSETGDEGLTWIEDLTKMTEGLTAFFKSAEGQEVLDNLVEFMEHSGTTMMWLVGIIEFLGKSFNNMVSFIKGIPGFFRDLWKSISDGASAVGAWISNIASISWDWIKDAAGAVGDFFVSIGDGFVTAYDTVVEWGGRIVDWIASIPGWIGQFFSNLPGWIADGLAALRDAIFYGIGYVAGLIVATFLGLPGAIAEAWALITSAVSTGATAVWNAVTGWAADIWGAITGLWSDTSKATGEAWDSMVEGTTSGVQSAWETVSALPGKVGSALASLPGTVWGWISDAWNRAREGTASGIDSVVSTAQSLPGRVGSALSGIGSWLYSAGQDLIRGLGDGISSMFGWAVDQAKAAARKIKEGFLDALGIKSPSRVMRHEVGHWLLPGVMTGVDDTIPDAQRHLGAVANMLVQGFSPTVNVAAPNVHTGDVMLTADLGEGIRQVVPLVITRNPRVVAGAAAVGNRERTGWVNTGRGAVTTR